MSCQQVGEFPASEPVLTAVAVVLQKAGAEFQRLACGSVHAILVSAAQFKAVRERSQAVQWKGEDLPPEAPVAILGGSAKLCGEERQEFREVLPASGFLVAIGQGASSPIAKEAARPLQGELRFEAASGALGFALYREFPQATAGSPPSRGPLQVPEPAGNLRQRSQWFQRRSGR